MQNSKQIILRVVLAVLLAAPSAAWAQNSSLNTFSPYTFYGLGDFSIQGPAFLRSMGGVGIGYRNAMKLNYLNPASYSVLKQKTFLFNVGIEGNNTYSKAGNQKTSHNSVNVRDIALAFPLGRSIGIGVSVTPLSRVGYRVEMNETDPSFLAQGMDVVYNYIGEGNVTQAKLGLGVQVFRNLALGADLIYYHGQLDRNYQTTITPLFNNGPFNNAVGLLTENISRVGMNFGLQYDLILTEKRILTFGATYRPKLNLRMSTTNRIFSSGIDADTISYRSGKTDFTLPGKLTAGFFYQTMRLGVGLDYSFEQWNGSNAPDPLNGIRFKNNQFYSAGIQYTPNPVDVRNALNRWTYRFGIRYNDYYMRIGERKINDLAFTVGVGIPIKIQGLSAVNVGLEFGRRGNTGTGFSGTKQFQMIRENYMKVSVGLSLFGEDDWFKRFKYQ